MRNLDYKPIYHRNLPHLQPWGAAFFITFRLAGSIPRLVLERWAADKRRKLAQANSSELGRDALLAIGRKRFREIENWLHSADRGPLWLGDERIAQMLCESLHYRDGKVYRLDAYCVMPNHVHLVFAPLPLKPEALNAEYYSLAAILHSLKGRTANQANRLLERHGAFWDHESYDHYIRDEDEWGRVIAYVLNNPVKANLAQHWQEWRWSYCRLDATSAS
ncbi:MAG TPA: transposase [Blastocatellia bacterium]|nr:transposase [Blastocatellia bacterium]